MRARAGCGEVDWCSAVGAVYRLDVLFKFLDLLRRQLPNKIFLPQELQESNVPAVFSGTTQVGEFCRMRHVVRHQE